MSEDREESTVAEIDERGRLNISMPVRKALGIEKGGLVRIRISKIELL